MDPLQDVIGHQFRSQELLEQALTHPSVGHESHKHLADNQRLEYLGDAVLQLTLSHLLFTRFPREDEGFLTKARAHLAAMKSLAALARQIGLGQHLIMGRGEEANGGRDRDSTLSDAFEAIIGAIYLDAGLAKAEDFVSKSYTAALCAIASGDWESNPKGQLQELIQSISTEGPTYSIIHSSGPDHARSFTATVTWQGVHLGKGCGHSKKLAEVAAAQDALENPHLRDLLLRKDSSATGNGKVQSSAIHCEQEFEQMTSA